MSNVKHSLAPFVLLFTIAGCDQEAESSHQRQASPHNATDDTAEPGAWLVTETDAPDATNPDFGSEDTVVLDELELPDGKRAQIVEISEDSGVGIIWFGAPPQVGPSLAAEYSPLELSQAFGTVKGPVAGLKENHELLATAGLVPTEARDLLAVGTTVDPMQATSVVTRRLCPTGAPSYWFNQWWNGYKKTCPSPTLCGSSSNDHTGGASGNFYIVAASSAKTALQTCNGGAPLGTMSTDVVNAQVQYKSAYGGWTVFYTSPAYGTEDGVVFTYYGFSIQQFRMRIYNANSSTDSLAAAIW